MTGALAAQEPWWTPGEKHGYHALTFGHLVGEVLRRIDGRSLGTYFREEVAAPLGLDHQHEGRVGPHVDALDGVHDEDMGALGHVSGTPGNGRSGSAGASGSATVELVPRGSRWH